MDNMKKYLIITATIMVAVLLGVIKHFQQKTSQLEANLVVANRAIKESGATMVALRNRSIELSAIDWWHTNELRRKNEEIDAMRGRLATGHRMYVKGKCPTTTHNEGQSSGSMGNDATIKLSESVAGNVFDIAKGIASDQ
ncbi:lysis system i-spanin subunit Rz [Erwinia psidii]|uniref:lysis system i-spanin subunit Rz n=1 Tax=Erwinia psidii TaxID=69224 RepID=UPI00397E689C